MPKEKGDKMAVTIWIDKDVVGRADRLADKGGLTRSKLLANVIEVGVEELVVADKIGLWALARVFRDLRESVRERVGKSVEDERERIEKA